MQQRNGLSEGFSANAAADYPTGPGKALTAGEAAFVKSIFGEEIDTGRIRKHFSLRPHRTAAAGTYNATTVQFFGLQHFEADYSTTKNLFNYGMFIHEMTHIWQNSMSPLRKAFLGLRHPTLKHAYKLTAKSRFKDFGIEQQGYIIEDYARACLFPDKGSRPARGDGTYLPCLATDIKPGSLGNLALLQKVVEERFPEARKTRLALEARADNTPSPAKPGPNPPPPQIS